MYFSREYFQITNMKKIIFAILAAVLVAGIILLVSAIRKSDAAVKVVDDEANEDLKSMFRGEMDSFSLKKGRTIDFFSIKHGSVAIRAAGKWIYVDPVGKGAEPQTDYTVLPKADYILVTHSHGDHLDAEAISQLSTENTKLLANPASIEALGYGNALTNGDSFTTEDGWTIDAVPAYNNSEEKLNFHPQGRDNGYVLTIDGFRVYVAGDTEVIPELADIKDIDVAFLPCNLPFTMTPEQCAEAAKTVSPKVLFPYHYAKTDLSALEGLLEGSGIEVRIRQYQ